MNQEALEFFKDKGKDAHLIWFGCKSQTCSRKNECYSSIYNEYCRSHNDYSKEYEPLICKFFATKDNVESRLYVPDDNHERKTRTVLRAMLARV